MLRNYKNQKHILDLKDQHQYWLYIVAENQRKKSFFFLLKFNIKNKKKIKSKYQSKITTTTKNWKNWKTEKLKEKKSNIFFVRRWLFRIFHAGKKKKIKKIIYYPSFAIKGD